MTEMGEARRATVLGETLKGQIRRNGPMPVADFVRACLTDAEHGYYRNSVAVGRSGDFITAPEISQTFGELIGLWAAVVWQSMGQPARVALIELGPGRGTLLRDALTAARRVPGFLDALSITLVDVNERLRRVQEETLAGVAARVRWLPSLNADTIGMPAIVIANEYLDALGVDQAVSDGDAWCRRVVALDAAGELQFGCGERLGSSIWQLDAEAQDAGAGTVAERPGFLDDGNLKDLAKVPLMAGLFIDYGHTETTLGDSLQAVRQHAFEHPLTSPGEADLTLQVDFEAFGAMMSGLGYAVDGPVIQAEFLGRLGIIERASRLMSANPAKAGSIEAGVARLLAPNGMGSRFKVMGVRSMSLPPLPGLEC